MFRICVSGNTIRDSRSFIFATQKKSNHDYKTWWHQEHGQLVIVFIRSFVLLMPTLLILWSNEWQNVAECHVCFLMHGFFTNQYIEAGRFDRNKSDQIEGSPNQVCSAVDKQQRVCDELSGLCVSVLLLWQSFIFRGYCWILAFIVGRRYLRIIISWSWYWCSSIHDHGGLGLIAKQQMT